MQRQSNNVMIQNFIFRIVFLLISKITVILVTDRQEFSSSCSVGNKTKLSDTYKFKYNNNMCIQRHML